MYVADTSQNIHLMLGIQASTEPNLTNEVIMNHGLIPTSHFPLCSLIHLIYAIACAHTSTCATSLMHVKNSTHYFFFDTYYLELWNEENRKTKT